MTDRPSDTHDCKGCGLPLTRTTVHCPNCKTKTRRELNKTKRKPKPKK